MLADLQSRLGYSFQRPDLLTTALTHRSYYFEHKAVCAGHFERLEFLGDSVLDLVLSEHLMREFPEVEEGVLSKWRASLVNETVLAEIARALELQKYLFLGRSEATVRDNPRSRLLASALEALFGAVYTDGGLESARRLIGQVYASRLQSLNQQTQYESDFKTRLQEWTQKRFRATPEYRLVQSEGPEHAKRFRYEVLIGGVVTGTGEGSSRKFAEQEAARAALATIEGEKT